MEFTPTLIEKQTCLEISIIFSNILNRFGLFQVSWACKFFKRYIEEKIFPTTLADKCIKVFLNKQLAQKFVEHVLKKEF